MESVPTALVRPGDSEGEPGGNNGEGISLAAEGGWTSARPAEGRARWCASSGGRSPVPPLSGSRFWVLAAVDSDDDDEEANQVSIQVSGGGSPRPRAACSVGDYVAVRRSSGARSWLVTGVLLRPVGMVGAAWRRASGGRPVGWMRGQRVALAS